MMKCLLSLPIAALVLACGDDLPDGPRSDEDLVACLPGEVVTALERHSLDLSATAGLLAGHPSAREVTGFLLAPALPFPPALSAAFAGPLVMECAEARFYEPWCEVGRCSRIECTGHGAGWIHHLMIDRPVSTGRWYIEQAEVRVGWEDGDAGTAFVITTAAHGPSDTDVSMIASGRMDEDELLVIATFPALHPAGAVSLELAEDAAGLRGVLAIGGLVVAELDAAARMVPTGECPD